MVGFRSRRTIAVATVVAVGALGVATSVSHAEDPTDPTEVENPDAISVVTLRLADDGALDTVVDGGYDLDHDLERLAGGGYEVTGIVTNAQIAELRTLGVEVVVEASESDIEAARETMMAEREAVLAANDFAALQAGVAAIDHVVVARADYFVSQGTEYISVEAKSSDQTGADLTIEWDAGPGSDFGDGGSAELNPFVDAGQYLYHRGQFSLDDQAAFMIADGSAAGSYEAVPSAFGGSVDAAGVTGTVELVNDGSGDPTLGCDPLVGFTAGNVALFDRGSCPFTQKVANAQDAGATAAIVANNNGGAPFAMTGGGGGITIPSAMISQADGAAIRTGLPATGSLSLLPPKPSPTKVRVTSSNGGSAEADFTEWLPGTGKPPTNKYIQGFLDHYPDAYELTQIIEDFHAQYPNITEIIELPNLTNGYRRQAMYLSDTSTSSTSQRVVVTSHAWGHEGGNDLTIELVDPAAADSPLSVSVVGTAITVSLATDAGGVVVSTAAEVVAAINASPDASALVFANTYRGNDGDGVVLPAGPESFSDGLSADPADVPREPFQVKALRIGKHRDGSRPGVLTYSQEHAREWQTPLVNIETAYRLLNNYDTDTRTRRIVNNLDIFIIPTINPDGALYSYNDFASQRKNMTNHCEPGESNDYNARNSWGVDNNRNYTVGSLFDGYDGASTSCTSATFAGPSELSEPESANLHWMASTFDNIEYAMNIHSSGNYFMWSPGAYIEDGRETLPRPSVGEEEYFYEASGRILEAIKRWRGLAVTPARTGPIADVLYSAAGNSGDMLYYEFGIRAWNFEVGTSFQPSWDEAYEQMMEFANGVTELYIVALDGVQDVNPPKSWLQLPSGSLYTDPSNAWYRDPVEVSFITSEPADIYYTLDGSNPDFSSNLLQSAGIREGAQSLMIDATTSIRWFSVDASGNIEGRYTPGTNGVPNKARVTIVE